MRALICISLALGLFVVWSGEGTAQDRHHRHAALTQDNAVSGDAAATREFKAAHARMMRNMNMPFTGDPDVDFRMHMIPHHQGAMDMAWVALRHAKDPWTRQAAQTILIDQQQEIAQFQLELARRGAKVPPGGQPRYIQSASTYPDDQRVREEEAPGGRDELVVRTWAPGSGAPTAFPHSHTGRDEAAIREFKAAHERMMRNMAKPFTGDPDVDFRTHMIPHHQGAIDMARVATRHAKNPWVRQSADAIIVSQQRDIYHFKGWLAAHGADAAQ